MRHPLTLTADSECEVCKGWGTRELVICTEFGLEPVRGICECVKLVKPSCEEPGCNRDPMAAGPYCGPHFTEHAKKDRDRFEARR